ncbi:hypothetical protein HDE_06695 [Halotydeus destructor]|nr:hypothetical protein HDE_06695 [Halotydeus destructor]
MNAIIALLVAALAVLVIGAPKLSLRTQGQENVQESELNQQNQTKIQTRQFWGYPYYGFGYYPYFGVQQQSTNTGVQQGLIIYPNGTVGTTIILG